MESLFSCAHFLSFVCSEYRWPAGISGGKPPSSAQPCGLAVKQLFAAAGGCASLLGVRNTNLIRKKSVMVDPTHVLRVELVEPRQLDAQLAINVRLRAEDVVQLLSRRRRHLGGPVLIEQ